MYTFPRRGAVDKHVRKLEKFNQNSDAKIVYVLTMHKQNRIKDDVAELLRRYPPDCLPPVDAGDEPLNIPQSGATQDNNIISAF